MGEVASGNQCRFCGGILVYYKRQSVYRCRECGVPHSMCLECLCPDYQFFELGGKKVCTDCYGDCKDRALSMDPFLFASVMP